MRDKSQNLTRRAAITGTGSALSVAAFSRLSASAQGAQKKTDRNQVDSKSLAGLAAAKGLAFGASFAVHELDRPHGERYAEIYRHDCQVIASELCLKLAVLRPAPHVIDFDPADRFFAFAAENGLGVHGHTLIWDDYVPDWTKTLSRDEVDHLLNAHILTVLERYQGKAETWDVVNEPIAPWDKNPGNLRQGPFYGRLGEDYIAKAFRLARQIEPNAKLRLNEAQTESADENGAVFRKSLLALLKRQLDQGVPIDAVGLQCHLQTKRPYDFEQFADYVAELLELGLDVEITELDVNDNAYTGSLAQRDQQVAALYSKFLTTVLANPAISSLVLWQMSDATSWMADPNIRDSLRADGRAARPLPYDKNFQRKKAWTAIADALEKIPARAARKGNAASDAVRR